MDELRREEILPGVWLTACRTDKFKTSYFSLYFLTPLARETAAMNALFPRVLRRGTAAAPETDELTARLDRLYGGILEADVRRQGEVQCVGFEGSFLDGRMTPGEDVLAQGIALLGEVLLDPLTEGGAFRSDYVEAEKRNLIQPLRGEMNDKRQYAQLRTIALMCAGEACGVNKLGDEETASAVTGASLFAQYRRVLETAPVELFYSGSAEFDALADLWRGALSRLPVGKERLRPKTERTPAPASPRRFADQMEVTQGKMVLGLRTGCALGDKGYPALLLANALFGGTTNSKLFLHVREELSLCYYASSVLDKHKGLMLVSCGVEFDRFDQAREEILRQLDACRRGDFTQAEWDAARRSVLTGLRAIPDSQGQLGYYWLGQQVAGTRETPEALARRVEQVTKEEAAAAAAGLTLDCVYYLEGGEQ